MSQLCAASLSAQTRLSDKDVLQHMKNLKDDAKKFRPSFNSALSKSTIRKNTQEKDAIDSGAEFRKANEFDVRDVQERHQSGTVPAELPGHRAADRQSHDQHALDPAANTQWSTVKTELNTLATAFHVSGV